MKRWARATVAAVVLGAAAPCQGAAAHLQTCLSPGETRDTLQSQKLVQPFRAMAEAARVSGGDSISIRLCRLDAQMVYDVVTLRRDGRLIHLLVDASNGAALPFNPDH